MRSAASGGIVGATAVGDGLADGVSLGVEELLVGDGAESASPLEHPPTPTRQAATAAAPSALRMPGP